MLPPMWGSNRAMTLGQYLAEAKPTAKARSSTTPVYPRGTPHPPQEAEPRPRWLTMSTTRLRPSWSGRLSGFERVEPDRLFPCRASTEVPSERHVHADGKRADALQSTPQTPARGSRWHGMPPVSARRSSESPISAISFFR